MISEAHSALRRYKVLGLLGEGGSSAVYEARDRMTDEPVALKELMRVNATTIARFKQEFRAVQEVYHPNLVRLDGLFEEHGKWLIAMELVPGTDLLSHLYVGDSELGFDEHQLRDAFSQLAEGLTALHAAGFVHRDVKPSNVRVTPEGRLVLLDFGLATHLDPRGQSSHATAMGTVAYMAPEQAAGRKVGPAADWYAFGVCLYEALTGVLPIDAEAPLNLLLAKQQVIAPLASAQRPGIPADLDALCASLLAIAPESRPTRRIVRDVLARRPPTSSSRPALPAAATQEGSCFEGRETELSVLDQVRLRVEAGTHQVILVEGDSGIGKSALVEHFLASLGAQGTEPLILRSRCYENELLGYKAFDGAMDELSRFLASLPAAECEALLPPHAALLCRLFPALEAVTPLARAPLRGLAADPSTQRLEAFSALRRLLARLSEQRLVVLSIDDLQWADAESFRLLHSLLAGPESTRTLILATVRPRAELESETSDGIDALRKLGCVTELQLSGLPRESAWALARDLMGPAIPDSWIEVIARESAGHPLFVTVLARFAESQDPNTAAELTLDGAIAARIGALSSKGRALIEAVAVVGSPLAAPLCGRAAGLGDGDLGRLVTELCNQKLLRRRRAGEIACFHDRIRRVAVECLPLRQTKAIHAQIAAALATQRSVDPARLARHYEGAGQSQLACEAYQRGAESALSSLAFARAAILFGRALDVSAALPQEAGKRLALQIARGHALARAGRSAEAARQYLEAAGDAEGEDKTRLRIWAAQHLLQSAHVEEGMAAARELLDELGVPLPGSTAATFTRLIWDRAWLKLRGLHMTSSPGPIPMQARMRLDALWGLAMPVAWLEPLTAAALSTRHLRLARAHGEPTHMARALAEEAFARTLQDPNDAKADELLSRARALSATSKDPALEVAVSFREAAVATFRWDLPRAHERLEHALRVGTESCPDQPWLLTNVRTNLGTVRGTMGEHALLAASCSAWLVEARERNDQFALSMLEGLGYGFIRHLMADDPDLGRASLDAALSPWPREPFSFAHFGEFVGVMHIEGYRGGEGAQLWLERQLPRLSHALMLKMGMGKATLGLFRALAALAARRDASDERAAGLLAEARAHTRKLRAAGSMLATMSALSFEAQLEALDGDVGVAIDKARQARTCSERSGYAGVTRGMQYLEGLLEGGDAGRQKREAALAVFATQGWKSPRRAVSIVCPVLDELEARSAR